MVAVAQGAGDDKRNRAIERQSAGANVLFGGNDTAGPSPPPASSSSSSSSFSPVSFDPLARIVTTAGTTTTVFVSALPESAPPSRIGSEPIVDDSPLAFLASMAPAEGSLAPSTSTAAFSEAHSASAPASPSPSFASTSSHRLPAPASPTQSTTLVADRTAIHLARPTASPGSPLSAQRSQVQDVLALFGGARAAAAGEGWEPIATDPDAALDPNDYSTLDLLEHLHPADLRALVDSIKTWPESTVASGSRSDTGARGASNWQPFFRQGESAYGPPPPLLRVQDAGGKLAKRNGKRAVTDPKQQKRQATQGDGSGPSAEGYPICTTVSNAVLSCYPQSNTTLVQNVWSKFIWNNNYPTFIGSTYVDIYLYNAGSEQVAANWTNVENNRGMIGILPQDNWFPTETSWVDGQNATTPYFFVITSAGSNVTGAEQHQATFTVVQTAAPTSLIAASLSSASGASAASLSSVLASLSAAQSSRSASGSATGNSNLQGDNGGSSFPHWAIALIVVLGVLTLAACAVLFYFMCVSARRKRQIRHWAASSPGSVGSRSPMIQPEKSALMGGAVAGAAPAVGKSREGHDRDTAQSPASSRPGSPLSAHDLAAAAAAGAGGAALSPIARDGGSSRAGHRDSGVSEEHDGPITSADASRMADAFRKALRKPEFSSGDPSPGSSSEAAGAGAPGTGNSNSNGEGVTKSPLRDSMHAQLVNPDEEGGVFGVDQLDEEEPEAREIMDRELASEGRSMASVENRRRPEVHAP